MADTASLRATRTRFLKLGAIGPSPPGGGGSPDSSTSSPIIGHLRLEIQIDRPEPARGTGDGLARFGSRQRWLGSGRWSVGLRGALYNRLRGWVTLYGVAALTFMMLMYWPEYRGPLFVLGFAAGCGLSSLYGFLSGAWPFGVPEAVWFVIAFRRYVRLRGVGGRVAP
jgi:hypothetical protein